MLIMKKINLPQAVKLISPNPVNLVCTQKPDGLTNLADCVLADISFF